MHGHGIPVRVGLFLLLQLLQVLYLEIDSNYPIL